jgi:hypothetical protein
MHVDLFTIDQAAALWAGYDPARISIIDSMKPSEVVAAKQMLVAGALSGALPASSEGNPLAMIGDHSTSLVGRGDLEKFAHARNLFPAFLFDTLAPFDSTTHSRMGSELPRTRTVDPPKVTPTNRGGRPQEHDWNSFVMEIIRLANQPDGLPETQAELVRQMLTWFRKCTKGSRPKAPSKTGYQRYTDTWQRSKTSTRRFLALSGC